MFFLNKDSFLKKKNVFIKKKQVFSTKKATTAIVTLILVVIIGLSGAIFFSSKNIDAEGYTDVWTNHKTELTEQDKDAGYIKITSPGQLAYISAQYREYCDKKIRLYADIDLSRHYWVPIKEFNGEFDGQGYTISYMYATADRNDGENKSGLFESLEGATIKNVVFKDCKAYANNKAGIVAGYVTKSSCLENILIYKSTVDCFYSSSNLKKKTDTLAGGVCGHLEESTISKCFVNNTNIYAYNSTEENVGYEYWTYAGGITGYSNRSTIQISYFAGGVVQCHKGKINYAYKAYCGGIAGRLNGGTIDQCYNTSSVYGVATAYPDFGNPACYNGGIVGYATNYWHSNGHYTEVKLAKVSNCFNKGTIGGASSVYSEENEYTVKTGNANNMDDNDLVRYYENKDGAYVMATGTLEINYEQFPNKIQVTRRDCYTGGIVGYADIASIEYSYNTGSFYHAAGAGFIKNKITLYYECRVNYNYNNGLYEEPLILQINISYIERILEGNIVGFKTEGTTINNVFYETSLRVNLTPDIEQRYYALDRQYVWHEVTGYNTTSPAALNKWASSCPSDIDYDNMLNKDWSSPWYVTQFQGVNNADVFSFFTINASGIKNVDFYAQYYYAYPYSDQNTKYASLTTNIPYTYSDSNGFSLDLYGNTAISQVLNSDIWARSDYINGKDPYIKAFYW